jgi:hypothetical protein
MFKCCKQDTTSNGVPSIAAIAKREVKKDDETEDILTVEDDAEVEEKALQASYNCCGVW